ncbi:MAG: adenylyltransferase/cytidyltransferase family protein [Candidatus Aminicenantes bacterium]|nr:adenylyltransferase/cytidyltransferase family protein [Candidatus Aminicenantes bacterium]
MSLNKFFPLPDLQAKIKEEKKKNKKIALANGCFDLIHIGHIRYLREAKQTADILVVALNADSSIKKLKGDKRAIIDEKGRIRIISSFECVDYVTLFHETTVDHVLLALKPDFHCKGSDYTADTVPERDTVKSYGGNIAIVGGAKVRSTTEIIKKITETTASPST